MRVTLLLNHANRSWILQKIAGNLARELSALGVQVNITDEVDSTSDVVHHMSWAFANIRTIQPSTMFITHLDDPYKIKQVISTLRTYVDVGVCMSTDTMDLLRSSGCPADSLTVISPAHDGAIKPRRLVIGITSRIYPDGRKREALLRNVAARMDLSAFTFQIFGLGWEPTIASLERAGATVEYFGETDNFRNDYETLQEAIPGFDFYLYLGMDEGSLGTLDALAAGIPTIVTPQGFHLDLPNGITYPIITESDLENVLRKIAAERHARTAAVSDLTWAKYANRHLQLWQTILAGGTVGTLTIPVRTGEDILRPTHEQRRRQIRTNRFNIRRLLAAVSHWPALQSLRRSVDRLRLKR